MLFYYYHHLSQTTFDDDVLFIIIIIVFFLHRSETMEIRVRSSYTWRWPNTLQTFFSRGRLRNSLGPLLHARCADYTTHTYTHRVYTIYPIPMSSHWKLNHSNSIYVPIVCVFSIVRPVFFLSFCEYRSPRGNAIDRDVVHIRRLTPPALCRSVTPLPTIGVVFITYYPLYIIYTHWLLLMNIVRDVRLDFGVRYRAHIRRVTSCVVNERDWFYFLLA